MKKTIVMKKSSKTPTEEITLVERISDLPDSLLCHILSSLPTKQVVATSILSRRWEFLWMYVDILKFDNFFVDHPNDGVPGKMQFAHFVHRVLQLLRTPHIKWMYLLCNKRGCTEYDVVTWIRTAISRNVEVLYLLIDLKFKWPIRLFYSQTLVGLVLNHVDITKMNIPTPPFFPKLKKLCLRDPEYETGSLERFISGCSILEEFYLYGIDDFVKTCNISSDTLKTIHLCGDLAPGENIKVVLNTPALEFLALSKMQNSELLVQTSLPLFEEAQISIYLSNLDSCLSNLACLSNVKFLFLEAIDSIRPAKSVVHAEFHNLIELGIKAPRYCSDLVRNFMEKADNLQLITITKASETTSRNESGGIWEAPQHVPKCLLSSLKVMCIKGYEDEEDVELIIKYVLENAKVLEDIKIYTSNSLKNDYKNKFNMLHKISKFPRASVICKISFY